MVSTYSANLRLNEQGTGDNPGTWGTVLNQGMIDLIDFAVAGESTISLTGQPSPYTLTVSNGAADQARSAILNFTGNLTGNMIIIVPEVSKIYIVSNNTSGSFTLSLATGAGNQLSIGQNTNDIVYTNGTDFFSTGGALSGTASGPIDMNSLLFDRPLIKRYREVYNFIGSASGSINLDYNNGNFQTVTLTGNLSITPTNWPAGTADSMTLVCTQDGSGNRTLSFATGTVKVPGGGGIILSTAPNAVDFLEIVSYDGGTTLYCALLKSFS